MRVQATANRSWDQALQQVALDRGQRPQKGEHVLALLRAGYHLAHLGSLEELLQSVLEDAVITLGAQRRLDCAGVVHDHRPGAADRFCPQPAHANATLL